MANGFLQGRAGVSAGRRWFGPRQMGRKANRVERPTIALHGSPSPRARHKKGAQLTIVGILIVVILVLLVIYLIRRV
jgi:type VI protein secretion system component VasF